MDFLHFGGDCIYVADRRVHWNSFVKAVENFKSRKKTAER